MKTRNGFVSNSSSTSFIVSADRKAEAEKMGLELISVEDLRTLFQAIRALNKTVSDMGADFLVNFYYEDEFKGIPDDAYITKPYDRDRAYEEGIDVAFSAFRGDL